MDFHGPAEAFEFEMTDQPGGHFIFNGPLDFPGGQHVRANVFVQTLQARVGQSTDAGLGSRP